MTVRTQQRAAIHTWAYAFKDANRRFKSVMMVNGPGSFPDFAIAASLCLTGSNRH
jgi:hypothetical protein